MFTAKSLANIPWLTAMGNHDYMGVVNSQLNRKDDPRFVAPDRNFKMTQTDSHGNSFVDIFVIDTNPAIVDYMNNPETPRQHDELSKVHFSATVQWLDHALAASHAPWKVVVGHHGLFSAKDDHNYIELQIPLLPLFQKYGVQVYYAGHNHKLEHMESNGMVFITSGAGSQVKDPKWGDDPDIHHQKFPSWTPPSPPISAIPAGFYNVNDVDKTTKYKETTVGFVMAEFHDHKVVHTYYDTKLKELHTVETSIDAKCNSGAPPGLHKGSLPASPAGSLPDDKKNKKEKKKALKGHFASADSVEEEALANIPAGFVHRRAHKNALPGVHVNVHVNMD